MDSTNSEIRGALLVDEPWIKELYKEAKNEIGSFNLYNSWDNYFKFKTVFLVVPRKAFVRYSYSPTKHIVVLNEIAVKKTERGNGHGKALLKQMPKPFMLKCNQDNAVGNKFYQALGMKLTGTCATKNGRPQNIYLCVEL